jgi:hypothetical protein
MSAGPDKKYLDELRELGLPPLWMRVAEAMGRKAFVRMWRELDGVTESDGQPTPGQEA